MNWLPNDVRYAVRSLARSPGLTLAAVLTLGLGIGANTAMFRIVDRLFLEPLPNIDDPSRVVTFGVMSPWGQVPLPGTYPRYTELRGKARSFSAIGVYGLSTPIISFGLGEGAQPIRARLVSASFLTLLGVRPALGRFFGVDEDQIGHAAHAAILSTEFWKRRFGGAPSALGTTMQLGRTSYTIVGIAPPGFGGVDLDVPDVWLLATAAAPDVMGPTSLGPQNFWIGGIGRLRAGVSPAVAAAEATAIYRSWSAETNDSTGVVRIQSIHDAFIHRPGSQVALPLWLAAGCGLVLLIACANVANLLLARAVQRRREIAVRVALGASRSRLFRQLLAEGGVLATLGGATAIVVAVIVAPILQVEFLPHANAALSEYPRVLAFVAGAVLITTMLVGLAPALQSSALDLTNTLKTGVREGLSHRSRMRGVLLAGQVALTLALLSTAGLFFVSLRQAEGTRLGFDTDRLISAAVDLRSLGYGAADVNALYDQMQNRIRSIPGISSTSVAAGSVFGSTFGVSVQVPGWVAPPNAMGGSPILSAVSPDYFRTLGAAILQGREFTGTDNELGAPVALVNDAMARAFWPNQNPLGKCFHVLRQPRCTNVVGVVENSHIYGLKEDQLLQFFIPYLQMDSALASLGGSMPVAAVFVRTTGRAAPLVDAVRREVQATSPSLPFPTVALVAGRFANDLRPWQLGSVLLGTFSGLALLLASIGLYGVLSYLISQRRQELGIRIALGASRADLIRLVVIQGLRITLVGGLVGIVGAIVSGKAVASMLYGVSPENPIVLIAAIVLLTLVSTTASYLAARRATSIEPMTALRYE